MLIFQLVIKTLPCTRTFEYASFGEVDCPAVSLVYITSIGHSFRCLYFEWISPSLSTKRIHSSISYAGYRNINDTEEAQESALEIGTCLNPDDCTANEYCDYKKVDKKCTCNPESGSDNCRPIGLCKNKCEYLTAKVKKHNSQLAFCDSSDDCEADSSCNIMFKSKCRRTTCDEITGKLSTTQCVGICTPVHRRMASASFDPSGKVIVIKLNFPAWPSRFSCAEIFTESSSLKLGETCYGWVKGTTMLLHLRDGATIVPDEGISFASDQKIIRDAFSGIHFSSQDDHDEVLLVIVNGCGEACIPPTTLVAFPPALSVGCSNEMDTPSAVIDGTYTKDSSGRPITCSWSVDASACRDGQFPCDSLEDKLSDASVRYCRYNHIFLIDAQSTGYQPLHIVVHINTVSYCTYDDCTGHVKWMLLVPTSDLGGDNSALCLHL